MTTVAFPGSDVGADARAPRDASAYFRRVIEHDVAGLRGFSLRRMAWALLAVALLAGWSTVGNAIAWDHGWPTLATLARLYPSYLVQYGQWVPVAALAGTLADNLPLAGALRLVAFGVAFMIAATAGQLLQFFREFACLLECPGNPPGRVLKDAAISAIHDAALASAISVACIAWRHDRAVTAALQAAELARADAERERLQATLAAIQARVDPTFLLDVLRDVGRRYATDRLTGARLLDLLIAYLRAALPRGSADSTLDRECALVRSWLGIAGITSAGRLAIDCRLDPGLRSVRVAPMLLLPLVIAANAEAAEGAVDVATQAIDGRVRVTIEARGRVASAIAASSGIDDTRARLRSMYGDRAALIVDRRGDGALQLIVEIPHERVDSGRR